MTDSTKKTSIIDQLSPDEALEVLKVLIREDESLVNKIENIAHEILSAIDIEEIASVIYLELDSLDVEELWDRSGRTRHGYVEPNEMASEMIDEVLGSFLENLKRYNQLSFREQAKRMYQFEQESQNDFVDWAVDMPGECAVLVLKEWKTSEQTKDDLLEMEQFIKQSLPSWHRFLALVVMPKRVIGSVVGIVT
jgi:hypothetical protein